MADGTDDFGGPAVPVLRMFDRAATVAFYTDYLGFALEWEHRFAPELPAYEQVRRGGVVLHLSEHYGDGSPNTVVWIPVRDAAALQAELAAHRHPRSRPGIDPDAPGGPTVTVIDPSGNELRFAQVDP
ncbi:glyoxalase superfamily protein [Tsukamurella sp. PLM1]|uniref:glyoxalase superfamily protein n=1 Tax=Tsukamurella sp. PLM1 TaxID=2929795 RepID=UPI0020BFA3DA|nr:glyoxalase superfamily protein [Tsukamurella sp. PLM1]